MALTQISTQGIKDGTVTGTDLATNIDLVDNQKLRLGNSQDLQIVHNGTESKIDFSATAHNLIILGPGGSNFIDLQPRNGHKSVRAIANGSVELYHDGSKKFETQSTGAKVTGQLNFDDGSSTANTNGIGFGSSQDCRVFHDGSSFQLRNTVGQIGFITPSGFRVASDGSNETMLETTQNGTVELYFDGTKKFETTSYGAAVSGIFTSTGDIKTMNDTAKFVSGASDDLQIYHDGSNSYIDDVGTGNLRIRSNGAAINLQKTNGENLALFGIDGAVELYFNNSLRLSTTANGVTLGHNLFLDNATNAGRDVTWDPANDQLQWKDNTKASFGNNSDLQIFHDGSDSYISNVGTGELIIQPTSNEIAAVFRTNSSVELFHDNSKKFETTSDGVKISGAEGVEAILTFEPDEGDNASDKFRFRASDSAGFFLENGSSNATSIKANFNGSVELYHTNNKKFQTTSTGVTVTSSGDPILTVTGPGHAKLNLTSTSGTDHCGVNFGDSSDENAGMIQYTNSNNIMVFHTNGSERVRFTSGTNKEIYFNGNITLPGLGNTTTGMSFETTLGSIFMSRNGASSLYVNSNGSGNQSLVSLRQNGTEVQNFKTQSMSYSSDEKVKKDIEDLPIGLDFINKLKPKQFRYKLSENTDPLSYGLIAQELEASLTSSGVTKDSALLCQYKALKETDNKDTSEYWVDYTKMIPVLIKAVQELAAKVAALEAG